MKRIRIDDLSSDECRAVQINGLSHCKNCKWQGISACEGKNIVMTGYNSKGAFIGQRGLTK